MSNQYLWRIYIRICAINTHSTWTNSVHNNCLKVTTRQRTANLCSRKKKIHEPAPSGNQHKHNYNSLVRFGQVRFVRLVYLFMPQPHIVVFIHEFISALQHLKHYCHIIGTLPNGACCQCIQSLQLTCPWVQ